MTDFFKFRNNLEEATKVKQAKKPSEVYEDELQKPEDDPCWEGYVQVGTKTVDGKEVPNCVPMEEAKKKKQVSEAAYYDYPDYGPVGASEMAQTQLHFIKYAADDITRCLKMGCPMPEWYQNKLAKIEGDMEGLYSYMKGKTRKMQAHQSDRYGMMGMGRGMYEQTLTEAKSGGKEAYQKFFNKALKKFGVDSPAELKGDKEKEFYDYVDKNWKADDEKKNESVQIDEVTKRMEKKYGKGVDLTQDKGKYYIVPKKGDRVGPFKSMRDIENHLKESYITEKLKPSDDVSTWIEDFYKSDAPQFKGKDKEERREMAVAAWLEARREAGYDVEPNPVKEDRGEREIDRLVAVSSRDERKANKIASSMFRGEYEKDGSDDFVFFMFDDEDVADDFRDELKKQKIKIRKN